MTKMTAVRLGALLLPVAGLGADEAGIPLVPAAPVRLTVYKTGLMSGKKHVFEFPSCRGRLRYDERSPGASAVELTIDAARFDLKDEWLSGKDAKKVADYARERMLSAARYPEIRFVSRGVVERAPDEFTVRGDLTIRDRTRPVEASVRRLKEGGALEFSGSATVDMREFGLDPPKAALGTIGTNPKMLVEFRLRPGS